MLFAAVAFSAAASFAYILNDLFDRESDRRHPSKRYRPLASQEVSLLSAAWLGCCLLVVVMGGCLLVPAIALPLSAYLLVTSLYSWKAKHWAWLDIAVIALAFVLRVETGIRAIGVPASPWMLSSTAFLALYIAAAKRGEELANIGAQARAGLRLCTQPQMDATRLMSAMAAASSYAVFSVMVRPALIPTIALVIIGIGRFEARTRALHSESAVDVVLGDWPLMICLLLWVSFSGLALLAG